MNGMPNDENTVAALPFIRLIGPYNIGVTKKFPNKELATIRLA
jgi:hypothetical protein